MIYSIKVTDLRQKGDRFLLSAVNNGCLPLTCVQAGVVEMNGSFKSRDNRDSINPREEITASVQIENDRFYGLVVRTAEGVGEIYYRA